MRGIEYGMRRSLDDVVFGSMMSSVAICPSFSSFPHLSSLFLINIALSLYVCMYVFVYANISLEHTFY